MFDFLNIPERSSKPRDVGLTHVVDPGVGVMTAKHHVSTCGDIIDIAKLGWGTGCVCDDLREKIDFYEQEDINVCFGGTLFELSVMQGQLDEYIATLRDLGVNYVEVSAGVIDMDHDRKCECIDELSEEFTVLSEIGRKDSEESIPTRKWIGRAKRELEAGSWKVITEGRASGTAGIYRDDGGVRDSLIEVIADEVGVENVLFEAPKKEQQAWFVEEFGTSVNVGNVELDDVIGVETLRLGLRGDTIETVHGAT